MKNEYKIQLGIHRVMSLVGGFIGAYTIFNRDVLFGAAQTSNMIYMTVRILDGNFKDVLFRFLLWSAYVIGLAAFVFGKKYLQNNLKILCIFFEMIVVIASGFLSKNVNQYIAVCPIAIAMALQWNVFPGVGEYVSSTVFSTNNLRQTVISLTEFFVEKDQAKLAKFKFFGGTLIFYHIGVAASWILTSALGLKSMWFCVLPLLAAATLELVPRISQEKACSCAAQ
jgi:uncharacterized membrane protein YoaK (UPF0700 family)